MEQPQTHDKNIDNEESLLASIPVPAKDKHRELIISGGVVWSPTNDKILIATENGLITVMDVEKQTEDTKIVYDAGLQNENNREFLTLTDIKVAPDLCSFMVSSRDKTARV